MSEKILKLPTASMDHPNVIFDSDAEICVNCTHLYRDSETAKQGACRRYPPTVLAVPQQHPLTKQMVMTMQSLSAPVPLDYWCGEFEPSIESPIE